MTTGARMAKFLAACLVILAAMQMASCGGSEEFAGPLGIQQEGVELAAPELLHINGGKVVSGAPEGIYVTWTRSTSPDAVGYYLYRDTDPIPDPRPGETLPTELRVNEGNPIAQPLSGDSVTHNDLFDVVIGETYFYRVTVVNDTDDESRPSNEISWTVQGHNVTTLDPTSAAWGDTITVNGEFFGAFDVLTDAVQFTSADGNGIEGAVQNWAATEIEVTVPTGAITGPVGVIAGGTIAFSDDDLTITSPYITMLTPQSAFVGETITINGANLGAVIGGSTVMIDAADVTANASSWSPSSLELTIPESPGSGEISLTVAGQQTNSLPFRARPEILSMSPASVQDGEEFTITGRFFEAEEGELLLDGTTPLSIIDWQDTEITATMSGTPGAHFLRVVAADDTESNDFDITLLEPLTVSFSGLTENALYRYDEPYPLLTVTSADDVQVLRLVTSNEGHIRNINVATQPYEGELPINRIANGEVEVWIEAVRGNILVESNRVTISVFSLPGDVNGDGLVNDADTAALEPLVGLTDLDAEYRVWFDGDENGVIDERDLARVGYRFGDEVEVFTGEIP